MEYKPTKFELEIAMKVTEHLNLCQTDYIQFELDKPEYEEDNTYTSTMVFPDKGAGLNFASFLSNNVEDSLYEVADCFDLEDYSFDVCTKTCNVSLTE